MGYISTGSCDGMLHIAQSSLLLVLVLMLFLQVLDSPFSRLTDLMLEIVVSQRLPIPKVAWDKGVAEGLSSLALVSACAFSSRQSSCMAAESHLTLLSQLQQTVSILNASCCCCLHLL
jgi:hypothetical protein